MVGKCAVLIDFVRQSIEEGYVFWSPHTASQPAGNLQVYLHSGIFVRDAATNLLKADSDREKIFSHSFHLSTWSCWSDNAVDVYWAM